MLSENLRISAKQNMTLCNACPICNGLGCKGKMPGPGGRLGNENFIRSYQKVRDVRIHMDVLHGPFEPDTTFRAFGKTFASPVFAAPIGMLAQNFGPMYDDAAYAKELIKGCMDSGICAFTGDGPAPGTFEGPIAVIQENGGYGIPTIKSWPEEKSQDRLKAVKESKAFALAMDVDCLGLIQGNSPFVARTPGELQSVVRDCGVPFIVKGIMTPQAAELALDAGASGIVVSTHGGRVLADALAPIEMLNAIAQKVKGKMTIFVDGGIRSGADVLKALALGADAVLIGRPFVVAAYGNGAQGVSEYANALQAELKHTMILANTPTLKDINISHVSL
ncbi:alpha-hydroxy-acid oxidizing protein [Christensenellaceae bacterium OttesenSCG-928-M15]|nr:alpha-hydroxy-acid oxidizing protein [Christensenellaceae bacterium OttesenSCG-928-M15]